MFDREKLVSFTPKFNFAFGIIVCIGGLIGYFKAQSLISLSMGLLFGNLLMLSIWGTKDKIWGFIFALVLSGLLLAVFIVRFIKTGSPMPALIIIPLAILATFVNVIVLYQKTKHKN